MCIVITSYLVQKSANFTCRNWYRSLFFSANFKRSNSSHRFVKKLSRPEATCAKSLNVQHRNGFSTMDMLEAASKSCHLHTISARTHYDHLLQIYATRPDIIRATSRCVLIPPALFPSSNRRLCLCASFFATFFNFFTLFTRIAQRSKLVRQTTCTTSHRASKDRPPTVCMYRTN